MIIIIFYFKKDGCIEAVSRVRWKKVLQALDAAFRASAEGLAELTYIAAIAPKPSVQSLLSVRKCRVRRLK